MLSIGKVPGRGFVMAALLAAGSAHGSFYEKEEIRRIAIEITDWNMMEFVGDNSASNGQSRALLPKDKPIPFPAGLTPENIVSMSAIIQSDNGQRLLPLGTLTTQEYYPTPPRPGFMAGPGGNIRIVSASPGVFEFRLHAFGKFFLGTGSTAYVPAGVFANTEFDGGADKVGGSHRGWLVIGYLGDRVVPTGTMTDDVHTFMMATGPIDMEILKYGNPNYRGVPVPSDLPMSRIVGLSATVIDDPGKRVEELGRHTQRGGYVLIENGQAIYTSRGEAYTIFGESFRVGTHWSDLSVNRGWIAVTFVGGFPSQSAIDPNIISAVGDKALPLGEIELSKTLDTRVYPVYAYPQPNPLFNPLALGGFGSIVRSDDGLLMENFILPMACRDYLSDVTYCKHGQGGKGGNVQWIDGILKLNMNGEGNASGASGVFSQEPQNWSALGFNRGYASFQAGDAAAPIRNFANASHYASVPAVHAGKASYYSFHVPVGASNVRIATAAAALPAGNVDLVVRKNGWPDPNAGAFDCLSDGPSSEELCSDYNLSGSGTYFIKVSAYGEVANPVNLAASYEYPSVNFQPTPGYADLIAIEAENYKTNVTQGGHTWTVQAATRYAGSQMRALPDNGASVTSSIATGSPRLDYAVNFPQAGTWYIWALGVAPNASASSFHMGLDGAVASTATSIQSFTSGGNWGNVIPGGVARITVSITGTHTLNVWMREDGFALDKILLTQDRFYVPKGSGPVQTFTTLGLLTAPSASYEAETYSSQSGNVAKTSGSTVYMDYGAAGSFLEWNYVEGGTGGFRTLTFRFANGSTTPTRKGRLYVNGVDMGEKSFAYTGGWTTWQTLAWDVPVKPGSRNVVRLTATTDGPNIDNFTVKLRTPAVAYEAEDGALTQFGVYGSSDASGGVMVSPTSPSSNSTPGPDRAVFKLNGMAAGTYRIWVRVIAPSTASDSFFGQMDGGSFTALGVSTGSSWHWDTGKNGTAVMTYTLAAGNHTFTIANREAGIQFDRIYITSLGDTPN